MAKARRRSSARTPATAEPDAAVARRPEPRLAPRPASWPLLAASLVLLAVWLVILVLLVLSKR